MEAMKMRLFIAVAIVLTAVSAAQRVAAAADAPAPAPTSGATTVVTEAYSKTPQHKGGLVDVESSLSKDRMVMMEVPFGPDRGSEQEGSPPDPV
ncbi:hypothetical protein WN943_016516 [Citrus x changshan-huyou]